jgi:hypothetical protein
MLDAMPPLAKPWGDPVDCLRWEAKQQLNARAKNVRL